MNDEIISTIIDDYTSDYIMTVDNLSWHVNENLQLLNSINFKIKKNKILGIVGANGAGKSSLLRCLYRVNQPTSGRVLLAEQDIWQINPQKFAQKVAVVLQESPADFALTVQQIIEMGRTPYYKTFGGASKLDNAIVDEVISKLELNKFVNRQFKALSGGEKQRVYLARALVQQPEILILDEPTNHLDIRHQLEIMQLISSLDITIIITLHDLNIASIYCDEILLLNNGHILAHDIVDNVLTAEVIQQAYAVNCHIGNHVLHQKKQFQFSLINN